MDGDGFGVFKDGGALFTAAGIRGYSWALYPRV